MGDWSLGRLLSTAARLVERDWNGWLARYDLTHAGFLALHGLADGPHAQRDLATASQVEEQTMSRVIDRLERTGHVTRQRDPSDRRRMLVIATSLGERTYRAVRDAAVADRLVADALDDPERFRAELTRVIEHLQTSSQRLGSD